MSRKYVPLTMLHVTLFLLFLATASFFSLLGYIYPEVSSVANLISGGALGGIWGILFMGIKGSE